MVLGIIAVIAVIRELRKPAGERTWYGKVGFVPYDFRKPTADRFREIIDKYGPDAVGILVSAKITNEENYLAQKFARAVLGTNNVDHCARL